MFGWFKSKEQKEREELERFQRWKTLQEEADSKVEKDRLKYEADLTKAAKQLEEEELKALKESDEPWCDWVAHGKDSSGQIRVQLDWNKAFIDYLRECGFNGIDENLIVQKYLAAVARELLNDEHDGALNIYHRIPTEPPEEK